MITRRSRIERFLSPSPYLPLAPSPSIIKYVFFSANDEKKKKKRINCTILVLNKPYAFILSLTIIIIIVVNVSYWSFISFVSHKYPGRVHV